MNQVLPITADQYDQIKNLIAEYSTLRHDAEKHEVGIFTFIAKYPNRGIRIFAMLDELTKGPALNDKPSLTVPRSLVLVLNCAHPSAHYPHHSQS